MTFLAGCAGGALAFVLLFALPELREIRARMQAARDQGQTPKFDLSAGEVLLGLLYAGGLIVLGGAAAYLFDAGPEFKDGMAYGIAGEALLGGLLRAQ